MKDYPVLCNDDTVRAIQAGLQTQVRRPVKPQPPEEFHQTKCGLYHPIVIDTDGHEQPGAEAFGFADEDRGWKSPFGIPGDRLWVRECWMAKNWSAGECAKAGCKGAATHPTEVMYDNATRAIYRASYNAAIGDPGPWHPNIHMPKWACRTFLPVTDVRVERVQDISEADAIAEGVTPLELNEDNLKNYLAMKTGVRYKPAFAFLWDSIYADKGLGWDDNPLVWVGTFRTPEQPEQ